MLAGKTLCCLCSIGCLDLYCFAVDDTRPTLDHLDAIFLEQCADTTRQPGHNAIFPGYGFVDINTGELHLQPKRRAFSIVCQFVKLFCSMNQCLGWNTPYVQASSAYIIS